MKRSRIKELLEIADDLVAVEHGTPLVRAQVRRFQVMLDGGLDPDDELTLVED